MVDKPRELCGSANLNKSRHHRPAAVDVVVEISVWAGRIPGLIELRPAGRLSDERKQQRYRDSCRILA